jgi:hypothetical protein
VRLLLPLLAILSSFTAYAADEVPQKSNDPWKGFSGFVSIGPSWRNTAWQTRPGIPNTVGGALAAGIRRSLGSVVYIGAASELAMTTQLSSSTNATIGDWGATEVFPFTPSIGFRIKGLHITLGYPLFGNMVLLSKTATGEELHYEKGVFYQGSVFFETASGLFGFQYRKGTFSTEKSGESLSNLDPKMDVSAFSLLFTLPVF